MTQKGTLHRRAPNELIRKQGEHISGQHDTMAISTAVQDTKREVFIFSGQKTDGAEQDVTLTELNTAEEERADLPFWCYFGLDSMKKLVPVSLQQLLCEQAIPFVIALGLLQTSPKKAVV